MSPAVAGAGVSYSCSQSKGAILTLEDKEAVSYDLSPRNEREFLDYILSNIDLVVASSEVNDINGLIAVTGCTLTGDWEAGVVHQSARGSGVDASGGPSSILVLRAEVHVQHSSEQAHQSSEGHKHVAGRPGLGPCCERPKNQCIFIRSFKFKKRWLRKPKHIPLKAAAEPKDSEKDDDDWCEGPSLRVPATAQGYESDESGSLISSVKFPPEQNVSEVNFRVLTSSERKDRCKIQRMSCLTGY